MFFKTNPDESPILPNIKKLLFLKNFSPQDEQFTFLEIEPKLIGQIKLNFIENNKVSKLKEIFYRYGGFVIPILFGLLTWIYHIL